ncbi:MarR family transcriptional regulator [Paenibacillus thiaminolyticus]|uniref:MarR family transcriptional regulator n=1 Tax=Paenibacillus thiaminolyticus TaxID=49283 RepID=A0AAP9J1R3_PANTH|nr:MarR family transcriptional regulator [Paenibacillus thiaminolyticus]MCY9538421.1 MarR family transcriptional regulator [Paenibacillus thiaminolyticus]MCY9604344.1 MarR family transcriptional regulator [Paenibacillus thiaminolyticus]MCY9609558.1 MarR family transcriptional regulator [Paenibacillus thiaminolyticus]MCY9616050.1 MarR family transcriptional regulator [Paenibacillus thiaminolyticus]MCY9621431.1 MarR family transcriptional regulator [Paenibacillus thiaminolyticus]
MKKASDDLIRLVKEMTEADYAMNVMLLQAHESLIDSEITAKQTILLDLVHNHGRLTVSELADRMKVSSSAVSQIVSKLEKAKYVSREINPNNRREIFVRLDERGAEHFAREEELERTIIDRYYTQLDYEEVVALRNIIMKLKGIVEKDCQGGAETD